MDLPPEGEKAATKPLDRPSPRRRVRVGRALQIASLVLTAVFGAVTAVIAVRQQQLQRSLADRDIEFREKLAAQSQQFQTELVRLESNAQAEATWANLELEVRPGGAIVWVDGVMSSALGVRFWLVNNGQRAALNVRVTVMVQSLGFPWLTTIDDIGKLAVTPHTSALRLSARNIRTRSATEEDMRNAAACALDWGDYQVPVPGLPGNDAVEFTVPVLPPNLPIEFELGLAPSTLAEARTVTRTVTMTIQYYEEARNHYPGRVPWAPIANYAWTELAVATLSAHAMCDNCRGESHAGGGILGGGQVTLEEYPRIVSLDPDCAEGAEQAALGSVRWHYLVPNGSVYVLNDAPMCIDAHFFGLYRVSFYAGPWCGNDVVDVLGCAKSGNIP